ncbi:hypothetical protein HU200_064548 [Digitaria exilis]|uniref:Uncharacterized protein n=1 Tax=Digitaria exilis TaxID=1010633 RepID=A0A835DY77_9POAL|nr:hypothetical protein HU200_064548 [Digitaria exilis]
MAGGDLSSRRRSKRLKEASQSEASRMIKLKREWRVLLDHRMAGIEAHKKDEEVRHKALVELIKARSVGAPPLPSPPLPCDPLPVVPPPPAGPKKKAVKQRVPQERIDHMILNLRDPYNDGYPLERLRKRDQSFRESYAESRAIQEKLFEYRQAIIKQFRQKGYAEDYAEVEDADAEDYVEVKVEDDAEEN